MKKPREMGAVVIVMLIVTVVVLIYVRGEPADPSRDGTVRIEISRGNSTSAIAHLLADSSLIQSTFRFRLHVKWRRLEGKLQAGIFDIPKSYSMSEIATTLAYGGEALFKITIPEGWPSSKIASLLESEEICDSAGFMNAVRDTNLIRTLGFTGYPDLEGFLFPETYSLRRNESPEEVVHQMVRIFKVRVGSPYLIAAREDPLGLRGVVILASIIQGEFVMPDEAPEIAALYRNRVKKKMLLQADPTIQFLLQDGPRRLLNRDLELDSPYNTYRRKGLPPGPIGNPGLVALKAALNPSDKPWLFMVAKGDGSHAFTQTLEEHLQMKSKFDLVRRQVARERKARKSQSETGNGVVK